MYSLAWGGGLRTTVLSPLRLRRAPAPTSSSSPTIGFSHLATSATCIPESFPCGARTPAHSSPAAHTLAIIILGRTLPAAGVGTGREGRGGDNANQEEGEERARGVAPAHARRERQRKWGSGRVLRVGWRAPAYSHAKRRRRLPLTPFRRTLRRACSVHVAHMSFLGPQAPARASGASSSRALPSLLPPAASPPQLMIARPLASHPL